MNEFFQITLTACVTIFGSVLVFVAGQLLAKYLIEPTHQLRKVIGRIRFNLLFHAGIILTPIARTDESTTIIADTLLRDSCELLTTMESIPFYSVLSRFSRTSLPEREAIEDAARNLRGLSNGIRVTGDKAMSDLDTINKRVERISTRLNLPELD